MYSGIWKTEEYINKPLMSLILRFTTDQRNTEDSEDHWSCRTDNRIRAM